MARRRIFFATYGGGHVNMIVPVIRELERRGSFEITTLGLTTARPVLDAAGIPALGFRDLVVPGDEAALEKGREIARQHHDEGKGVALEESIAYLGLSYSDLERRLGRAQAARRFAAEGRWAFLPLGPLQRLVRGLRPDVVVATNSPRAEEAALRVSRAFRIPSICMVDLFALGPEQRYLSEPGYADRLAVLSEWVRDHLLDMGREAKEIVVTGNPAFDRLADPDLPARGREFRRKRGWQDKKVILWASHRDPAPELPGQITAALGDAVRRHRGWHLVYRPHPNETAMPLPTDIDASVSGRDDDLAALLSAADVTVGMSSTVCMEGALMDKPIVKVCTSIYSPDAPYEDMGLALPVWSLNELEGKLVAALSDGPESRAMREARAGLPRPGTAAGRVADLVESLLS